MIEAVATIEAASNVIALVESESAAARVTGAAWDLAEVFLGWKTSGEDDPVEVEITARAAEIEADVLEAIVQEDSFADRIATLRAMAPRYREHGTAALMFRLEEPVERVGVA